MISKKQLQGEFEKVKKEKNPKITKDFEAVVILSGESGDPANPTNLDDTEERTQAGIEIFKKIKKLGSNPTLILNGTDAQNGLMEKNAKKEKVDNLQLIKNLPVPNISTLTQFQGLKNKFFKKIVIVTHAYHGPRVKKYAKKYLPKNCRYQLFLLDRDKISQNLIREEIEKILRYSQKGDL